MKRRGSRSKFAASKGNQSKLMRCDAALATFAAAPAVEGEAPKQPTFEINAYNGGAMRPEYYYAPTPVVVDLNGLTAAEPVAVLLDHYRSEIVGQSTKVTITKGANGGVKVDGVVTGDIANPTDPAHKVVMHARNGFQWKASVGIEPQRYERVEAGGTVVVNGREFAGPCYVMRAGILAEVSFLSVGADKTSSSKIAASAAEDMEMDFHDWLKAKGFDPTKIEDAQRDFLLKTFKAEQAEAAKLAGSNGAPAGGANGNTAPAGGGLSASAGDDPFSAIKAGEERRSKRRDAAVKFAAANPRLVDDVEKLLAAAQSSDMTQEMFDLQLSNLRGSQVTDNRLRSSGDGFADADSRNRIFEAGLCLAGKLPNPEQHYDERTLEAASRRWRHGLGLGELLLHAGRANGFDGLSHRNVGPLLEAAFLPRDQRFRASGPSTMDVSGILSNAQNKFIKNFFEAVDNEWRKIAAIRTVQDFKSIASYSLTGDFEYRELPPGGEIEHGTLGEESYSNQAKTYARMFAIDRRDIINDDLNAFINVARRLGRGAALKLNKVFWALLLNNGTFFTTDRTNYLAGAETAFGLDALELAEVLFAEMKDPDGQPMAVMPRVLVVPPRLKRPALRIMNSTEVREHAKSSPASTNAAYGTNNTFQGDFVIASSPYMANTSFTGASSKAWYLFADPNDVPVIEGCFLNGIEMPTVETVQADFDQLGLKMRGFYDFGFALQEPRGGVKMLGEAE